MAEDLKAGEGEGSEAAGGEHGPAGGRGEGTDAPERGPRPGRRRLQGGERAEYLFTMSSFVLIVIAIFVFFGSFIVTKRIFGTSGISVEGRNDFVQAGLLLGMVLLELSLILKLYALLMRFRGLPELTGTFKPRSEWFLKVSSATFSTAAAVNIAAAIYRSRRWAKLGALAMSAKSTSGLHAASTGLLLQSFATASFFLLFSIFTLVYLLNYKYSQFMAITRVVDAGVEDSSAR